MGGYILIKPCKNVLVKVAIAISIAIVFKKVNAKASAKAQKTILGGPLGPLAQALPNCFWALALALALTFLKTRAMEMAMATLIRTIFKRKSKCTDPC